MIRPARHDEGRLLSAMALRSKGHWGYDADFLDACRDELTVSLAETVRVHDDGEGPDGFYQLSVEDGMAEVDMLFVAPGAIGKGVGRALWSDLTDHARRAGAETLRVDSDPHAEGFYRAMGCRPAGRTASASIPGRTLPRLSLRVR
ncbi:MAG: GNAT family N-acetyltransferase [Alphaproteobacteria bacterium]|jgi:GNAT superfamily N-acetyltransferase|nr:GNAT family N-acetyltransferase [Alphaproteobacteria bacterium]